MTSMVGSFIVLLTYISSPHKTPVHYEAVHRFQRFKAARGFNSVFLIQNINHFAVRLLPPFDPAKVV